MRRPPGRLLGQGTTKKALTGGESHRKRQFRASRCVSAAGRSWLVTALGEQSHQDHEIGQGEEPIVGFAGGFGGASDEAEVARLGELADVLDTDAGQAGNFRIGEDFLARFDGNHGRSPVPLAIRIVTLALRPLQRAVCFFPSLPTMLKEG